MWDVWRVTFKFTMILGLLWGCFVFSQRTGHNFWIDVCSHMQLSLHEKKNLILENLDLVKI